MLNTPEMVQFVTNFGMFTFALTMTLFIINTAIDHQAQKQDRKRKRN